MSTRPMTPRSTVEIDGRFGMDILDAFPGICFFVSSDAIILNVNAEALELLGCPKSELLRSSFPLLLEDSFRERFRELLVDPSSTATHRAGHETRLLLKNGRLADVLLTISPYFKEPQEPPSVFLIVARDISETKKKELDLLRFSNIAHYTVNPLEITDVHGKIIYVNPAFEKASGYGRDELIGKNPSIFGSGKHPASFWKTMWETIKAGKVWVGEVENRRRDGEPFFTQLLVSPIIDASNTMIGYFGVHRNITQQKYLEKQLIHAQKMESIGLLAAGIAHEVGNPLTSISSLVQVIQRTTQDSFTQEKLALIKSQITRISRIIHDLVNFSRKSSYEVQLTDVAKNLREAVDIVRVGRKAREISFKLEINDLLPPLPLVPDQLQQIFINILINAVDAIHSRLTDDRKKDLLSRPGEIVVMAIVERDEMVVRIRDNGVGISEDALSKIFEPFYTTKSVGEGTGLGLWVSFGIIKSFQGSIDVKSKEGDGTTMTIRLPLRPNYS